MVPESRYAKCNGGHVAYQVIGEGPTDMVFMSAWFSHVDGRWEEPSFARMLRRFSSFSRLILFDKRGSGASDPLPRDSMTWEEWADDVKCVMDAAGSPKAAIVGVGDSGPIAMLFAATYPERVSALIVVNTAARASWAEDYPWGKKPEEVEAFLDKQEAVWGTGGLTELFSPSKAADQRYRQWWAKYQRMAASPGTSRTVARLIMSMDVREFLSTIQAPTMVIQRRDLPMVSVEHGRYLGDNIPGAQYVELPGNDYFIYLGSNDVVDEIEEFITGVRHVAEPDRVLATVLFTDIVDSTRHAMSLGDRRWRELLDLHDEVAKKQIEAFRGRLVKSTGDGVLATFDGPARAVHGALGISDRLHEHQIEVRAGLHAGEIEVRGDDLGGVAVHIGSRIMAVAEPGEVLASRTVKDLTVGSGIRFEDRGEHLLKGVPDPWQLYAVVDAG